MILEPEIDLRQIQMFIEFELRGKNCWWNRRQVRIYGVVREGRQQPANDLTRCIHQCIEMGIRDLIQWFFIWKAIIFIQENVSSTAICNMSVILSSTHSCILTLRQQYRAASVTRTSTAMELDMFVWDKMVLVSDVEGFQLYVPSVCWKVMQIFFLYIWKKIAHWGLSYPYFVCSHPHVCVLSCSQIPVVPWTWLQLL